MKRLTKSQYELIASTIKDRREIEAMYYQGDALRHRHKALEQFAEVLSFRLRQEDREFNIDQFLADCGIKD